MEMETLEPIIMQHSFFKDLPSKYIDFIVGCAMHKVFKEGDVILNAGDEANKFYLIRSGRVAIYIDKPRDITLQTLQQGDILGWSWLIPPYLYRFSAKALEPTRVITLDGKCLREKCEKNSDLGYELLKRLVSVFVQRLEAARLQLIDIYNINNE